MTGIAAAFFDGRSSRRWPAVLTSEAGQVVVQGEFGERRFPFEQVVVGEAMGTVERHLAFPDGSRCVVNDLPALAGWLAEAGIRDSVVVHLQRRWSWALGSLAGVAAVLVAAYVFLLPWVAKTLAPRVPAPVIALLSQQVLTTLDDHLLKSSTLPAEVRERLQGRLDALFKAGQGPGHRLHFRSSRLGPNAFALPDGQVVVFDELVKEAANDEEILGVLAHELGHVAHRHGLRLMIQSSVVSFAVGMYLGDLSSVAAGLGAMLLESRYSRDFELEADRYAAQVMIAAGYGTESLAAMLERLAKAHHETEAPPSLWDAFSSHPDTAERIARLRQMR